MAQKRANNAIIRNYFKLGRPYVFHRGEIILGNDSQPNGVHFIERGFVKTFSISDSGDNYEHMIYGRNDIIPIAWAYLGDADGSVYYQALAETLTWRISRSLFVHLIHSNTNLNTALSLQLARQFQQYSLRVSNLEYKKADQRVAYHLLYLCSRFGIHMGKKVMLDMPLTHELFASSVNLSRETVSRQIERLIADRTIRTSHHHYEILDMSALINKTSQPPYFENGGPG